MQVAIQARGLTKWFGEGEARTMAVQGVDLDVNLGEILFVVGPSGSGKTTMLSMISGILRPSAGTVTIDGVDMWQQDVDTLAAMRRDRIGFVFQDYHLFSRLTTVENVALPLVLRHMPWDAAVAQAKTSLESVGLERRADLLPVKLSGGEQQRVAIARATVGRPNILILDEPTASLDGDTGHNIMSFIRTELLTDERAIVVVTHDARILDFAHRIVTMEDGRVTRVEKGAAHAA